MSDNNSVTSNIDLPAYGIKRGDKGSILQKDGSSYLISFDLNGKKVSVPLLENQLQRVTKLDRINS